jgi:hypothetical protein
MSCLVIPHQEAGFSQLSEDRKSDADMDQTRTKLMILPTDNGLVDADRPENGRFRRQ